MLKIEIDEDGYQLLVDDEESGVAEYGEKAQCSARGGLVFTTVDSAEDAEDAIIYHLVNGEVEILAEDHEVEEVEFVLEEAGEDEGEAEGDEAIPA